MISGGDSEPTTSLMEFASCGRVCDLILEKKVVIKNTFLGHRGKEGKELILKNGRYKVQGLLGEGGFGVVLRVCEVGADRQGTEHLAAKIVMAENIEGLLVEALAVSLMRDHARK